MFISDTVTSRCSNHCGGNVEDPSREAEWSKVFKVEQNELDKIMETLEIVFYLQSKEPIQIY